MARKRRAAIGVGVGAAALGGAPAAQAAIIEVENLDDAGTDSLRQAVTDANATPAVADEIVFDSSLSGSILLESALPTITGPLEIDGPGADEIAVDAYYANARTFVINMTAGNEGQSVAIRGVAVWYGASDGTGGNILNLDSSLVVEDALVAGGTSAAGDGTSNTLGGGGIAVGDDAAAELRIERSAIVFNSATDGHAGGVGAIDEVSAIVNSTIAENEAHLDGGGLNAQAATIENSTIASNESEDDGGGIAAPVAGGGSVSLENSIVADNLAGDQGPDLIGSDPFTAQFSLIEDRTDASITEPPPPSNLGSDPNLGPVADNGGPTPTMLPAGNSVVKDWGKTAGGVTTDQRGEPRPFDTPFPNSIVAGADGADIGAVELIGNEALVADLALDNNDAPYSVYAGDPINYTLEIENAGPEAATGVEVEVFLPDLVAVNAAGLSPGCTSTPAPPPRDGTQVDCAIGSIVSGSTHTRTIPVTTLTAAGQLGYTYAYGQISGDQSDPNEYDNGFYSYTYVDIRPVVTPPPPDPVSPPPAFDLAGAIKKCKKKFRGKKRANCIKKARKKAAAAVQANPRAYRGHPFTAKKRPPALRGPEFRAYQRSSRLP